MCLFKMIINRVDKYTTKNGSVLQQLVFIHKCLTKSFKRPFSIWYRTTKPILDAERNESVITFQVELKVHVEHIIRFNIFLLL